MKVRWTARALRHVREIREYIAKDSQAASQTVVHGLLDASAQLARFPQSGRAAGDWHGRPYRELVVGHHRLMYEIRENTLQILAVVDARRDLRPLLTLWRRR